MWLQIIRTADFIMDAHWISAKNLQHTSARSGKRFDNFF